MNIWRVLCIGLATMAMALWPMRPAAGDDVPQPAEQPTAPPKGDRRAWKISIHQTGAVDPTAWQLLTGEQQKANLALLERTSREAFRKVDVNVHLEETPHFLIYHQIDGPDAPDPAYGRYLEQAYTNLAQLFGLRTGNGQGTNVWRGKAVFYDMASFPKSEDLVRQLHPSQSQLKLPCLTLGGDGSVDIVMYHGDAGISDYHNAVLAMTVGFLYRLHSPTPLPAWIETGFPAALADTMQYAPRWNTGAPPPPPYLPHAQMIAAEDLAIMDDLGALLDEDKPTYPDFSVYESLVAYMLQKNHEKFGALILDIKDGKNWKDSLQPRLGMDFKKLQTVFRASLPASK